EGMASVSNDDSHAHPRTLADATVLQIVPALREEPVARAALNVASALVQSGARALVAAEDGPLVAELTACGGDWVPLVNATVNPFKLRRGARVLERLIFSEQVDIVHAQSVGGAWIANMAAARMPVRLVTTLLDVPALGLRGYWAGALARGDWVITPSNFAAAPVMARYKIPRGRPPSGAASTPPPSIPPRWTPRGSRRCARRGEFRKPHASCSFPDASPLGMANAFCLTWRAPCSSAACAASCSCSPANIAAIANTRAPSRRRRRPKACRRSFALPVIAATCRRRWPPPIPWWCPRPSRRCSAAWWPKRKPWGGPSSRPTSAFCRSTSQRRRKCRRTCARDGWPSRAMREILPTRSARRSPSTMPPTVRWPSARGTSPNTCSLQRAPWSQP